MSDTPPTGLNTPQEDAERIRLKRLAKLQNTTSPAPSTPSPTGVQAPARSTTQPNATPSKQTPSSSAATSSARPTPSVIATPPAPSQPVRKIQKAPAKLDLPVWEHNTLSHVFQVTLDKDAAEQTGYSLVWLKSLAEELIAEDPSKSNPRQLDASLIDRLLIARLELDPRLMSDDLEYLPVLASLPASQTLFEYLVGCWKRTNAARSALIKKGYPPAETQNALSVLDKVRELVISYTGLTLQEPEMFPQPEGRVLGPTELIGPLLSISSLSAPLTSSDSSQSTLAPTEIEQFLQDLARRFDQEDELNDVLAPVIRQLLFHESLLRPEGLAGGDSSWRSVLGGLEALVSIKPIAIMITKMEEWIPASATAANFERLSLLGPLCRLGVFGKEWPTIAHTYFSEPEKRTAGDVESSFASLRGTLKSLQSSLFQIFNTLVRASADSREAVLQYFAKVISLNVKRAGMQVEAETVATDSFMVNLQSVMLRFAEPFIDANFSKIDRIDPLFYVHSDRIDLTEETRIKATSEEAKDYADKVQSSDATPPNFISNIFFLTIAMSHFGYLRAIQTYMDLQKHQDDMQRQLDHINGDGSWMGTPFQARMEHAINGVKADIAKFRAEQFAYETGLREPELLFRTIGFTNFLSSWVIRQVDPKKTHPHSTVELPLPSEVPMSFRVLPEYILEDVVDFFHFVVQTSPDSLELSGKTELIIFALTFLTSSWYIKNPFLKSKINDMLFIGIWPYGRERHGVLGHLLNTHPMALKHLMPALMSFYIEVEQTGASSQFYDKFNARRAIAYVLKVIWDNPAHRAALNQEAQNIDKFVRFVNLMINDVTYLMDESLSEMKQIHDIQIEMDDKAAWAAQPMEYRREREGTLRSLERQASSYTTLSRSTVELLKVFTAETKAPFMSPEIVDRLAAMLDYNLDALVGPKYQELRVRDPEKLKFKPKELLSDMLQVYINLSDQGEFVNAVAGDGRSYRKELFQNAGDIAIKRGIKSEGEIEKLRMFVTRVEEAKATMEAEEDLGEIPDEFLDPLMFTVMRDPVLLPSSRTIIDRSTIKSHLLSDSSDPFNRVPLSIEQVVPDIALKQRIDEFLSERRNKKTALDMPVDEVVHMDGGDESLVSTLPGEAKE